MQKKPTIITPPMILPAKVTNRQALPKVSGVHPFGSKILVEVLRGDEIIGTSLLVGDRVQADGAPQAIIMELGPAVPSDSGLKEGQRIYWTGRGTEVKDPRTAEGRVRALLEISNILAIIDEEA
jgi:hypothetical protein